MIQLLFKVHCTALLLFHLASAQSGDLPLATDTEALMPFSTDAEVTSSPSTSAASTEVTSASTSAMATPSSTGTTTADAEATPSESANTVAPQDNMETPSDSNTMATIVNTRVTESPTSTAPATTTTIPSPPLSLAGQIALGGSIGVLVIGVSFIFFSICCYRCCRSSKKVDIEEADYYREHGGYVGDRYSQYGGTLQYQTSFSTIGRNSTLGNRSVDNQSIFNTSIRKKNGNRIYSTEEPAGGIYAEEKYDYSPQKQENTIYTIKEQEKEEQSAEAENESVFIEEEEAGIMATQTVRASVYDVHETPSNDPSNNSSHPSAVPITIQEETRNSPIPPPRPNSTDNRNSPIPPPRSNSSDNPIPKPTSIVIAAARIDSCHSSPEEQAVDLPPSLPERDRGQLYILESPQRDSGLALSSPTSLHSSLNATDTLDREKMSAEALKLFDDPDYITMAALYPEGLEEGYLSKKKFWKSTSDLTADEETNSEVTEKTQSLVLSESRTQTENQIYS